MSLSKTGLTRTFSLLKVTFFSATVLLMETLLFNILGFIYNYFITTTGLGFVIIGIGLGAFAASHLKLPEKAVFTIACIGTTLSIYFALVTIVLSYPLFWIGALGLSICFFFPVLYISTIFRQQQGNKVYLFDMFGAFLGVVITVVLYNLFQTETILLLIAFSLPLIGCAVHLSSKNTNRVILSIYILLILVSNTLFLHQYCQDSFNLHETMQSLSRKPPSFLFAKAFRPAYKHKRLVKTYDNLRGRLDILAIPGGKVHQVSYNGDINDHFHIAQSKDWDHYYKLHGIKWPTDDIRVLYGVIEEPKICIIGAAAQGIVKTVKEITKLDHITAIEINPAIIQIMTEDFYEESGHAYEGLKPIIGNAISVLKSTKDKFDIITLINAHSTRTISYPGPPNYLHTLETYNLFFDHLSDKGYILFEERPITQNGKLAYYRQLNTLWHCLKQRGAKDPSKHFVIWEWMPKGYNETFKYRNGYYISMIVTKKPIDALSCTKINEWLKRTVPKRNKSRAPTKVLYFKDVNETDAYKRIFNMISTGNFRLLESENFDKELVTDNRPFLQMGSTTQPQLIQLLLFSGISTLLLWILFSVGLIRQKTGKAGWLYLNIYNIMSGMAYFLLEIMLLLIYQNIFLSAASTLILVLGILLLSSGIGGFFSNKMNPLMTTFMLIPVSGLALYLPGILLHTQISFFLIQTVSILLIAGTGFLMGFYFPKGLIKAGKFGLQPQIPYYFAINCIGGSFAIPLAIWLGVVIGYQLTIILAILFYLTAGFLLQYLLSAQPETC